MACWTACGSSTTPCSTAGAGGQSLRARISRHLFRFSDWSAEELLEELRAFEASDVRFGKFLEGLTSSDVIPNEPAQWGWRPGRTGATRLWLLLEREVVAMPRPYLPELRQRVLDLVRSVVPWPRSPNCSGSRNRACTAGSGRT